MKSIIQKVKIEDNQIKYQLEKHRNSWNRAYIKEEIYPLVYDKFRQFAKDSFTPLETTKFLRFLDYLEQCLK